MKFGALFSVKNSLLLKHECSSSLILAFLLTLIGALIARQPFIKLLCVKPKVSFSQEEILGVLAFFIESESIPNQSCQQRASDCLS